MTKGKSVKESERTRERRYCACASTCRRAGIRDQLVVATMISELKLNCDSVFDCSLRTRLRIDVSSSAHDLSLSVSFHRFQYNRCILNSSIVCVWLFACAVEFIAGITSFFIKNSYYFYIFSFWFSLVKSVVGIARVIRFTRSSLLFGYKFSDMFANFSTNSCNISKGKHLNIQLMNSFVSSSSSEVFGSTT